MNKINAPITDKAWEQINEKAKDALTSFLSGRKSLMVKGPYGRDYGVVNEGKLIDEVNEAEDANDDGEVKYSNYKVKPLTESRIEFILDRWELDNAERGDDNIDLDALEEACEKIALFEENAVYNGLEEAGIVGIKEFSSHEVRDIGNSADEIAKNISLAVTELESNFAHKPFDLIVCPGTLAKIQSAISVKSLYKTIEEMIGGKIILSKAIKGAILFPHNDHDFQLIIGQDFTIGYVWHNAREVKLYISESFTTRLLDEDIIVVFSNDGGAEIEK